MQLIFTYAEVVRTLALVHSINDDRIVAFKGRLQHFQRLKFPVGTNTGKGRAAIYGISQILLLAIALEFVQLGISPERAVSLLTDFKPILKEMRLAADAKMTSTASQDQHFMFVDVRALSSMQEDNTSTVDRVWFGSLSDLAEYFVRSRGQLDVPPRISAIDLTALIYLIMSAGRQAHVKSPEEFVMGFGEWIKAPQIKDVYGEAVQMRDADGDDP